MHNFFISIVIVGTFRPPQKNVTTFFIININAVGPYKDRFLPLRERSELPQLLLYFSSVFFSLKVNIRGHLPMKIFFS
jgi:hypothetical protein